MSKEEIEKQITDILYKNSNDDSECLIIKFENINKVIQLLVSVLKQPKSEANEADLRQLFRNNSNCYAQSDDVVLAITEDKFIELVSEIFKTRNNK